MSMHFRPKIQNGQVNRREPRTQPSRSTYNTLKSSPLTTLTPLWPGRSFSEMTQTGLSFIGLEENRCSIKVATPAQAKSVSRTGVLLGLILCGMVVASGFIFSLRDHFTAHAFGREEVKLKFDLDRTAAEHRALEANLLRATNPQEISQAARQATTLQPVRRDQKKAAIAAGTVITTEKAPKNRLPIKAAVKGTLAASKH